MKALSKKQKLSILKKMLDYVEGEFWIPTELGLCYAFCHVAESEYRDAKMVNPDFPIAELGITPPFWYRYFGWLERGAFNNWHYWPLSKSGFESRKRAIRSAIKRLERSQQTR